MLPIQCLAACNLMLGHICKERLLKLTYLLEAVVRVPDMLL